MIVNVTIALAISNSGRMVTAEISQASDVADLGSRRRSDSTVIRTSTDVHRPPVRLAAVAPQ